MEARLMRGLLVIGSLCSLGAGFGGPSRSYRTQNFIVQASSAQFAQQVGDAAEQFRRELAVSWLGHELPPWPQPCPIRVQDAPNLGAGGATEYTPTPRGVRDFNMSIQGSQQRILDSVLPHEITHTILATHFGRPLPRWADEGACTTVEHSSEKQRHEQMLHQFLTSNRGIPMNRMFLLRDYPRDILPLYAQGFSVSKFLIAQGGRRKFVDFVGEVLDGSQWTDAVRRNYGYESLAELQEYWLAWVADGSGSVEQYAKRDTPVGAAAAPLVAQASHESPVDSNVVVASESAGWYLRRRQQVAAKEATSSAPMTPRQSFEKKPLRGHNISRPQPVQGISPHGIPFSAVDSGRFFR